MATDYRNLKWGNDTPTQVIWKIDTTSYWPGIVKWGSDVVWARALDVNKDIRSGISSFTVTLTSSIVPDSITRGTNYYFGDVLQCDATYEPYWTGAASGTKALSECFNLSTSSTPSTFYVRSLFQPTRVGRTIGVQGDSHVEVSASYMKTDGTTGTISTKSLAAVTATAWAGDTIIASATYDTYYKKYSESNMRINPGTTTVTATASSMYKTRAITVNLQEGIRQENITYYATPTSWPSTAYVSSSGTATSSSYSGQSIRVVPTASQYWDAPWNYDIPAADNEDTVIVSSTPTRKMRKIIISNPDSRVLMTLTYTDASGNPQSVSMATYTQTSYTSPDTWCGAEVTYKRSTGRDPTEGVWFNNGALSGSIDPVNTTSSYTLDMGLKTFDLKTYSNGVITYYTNSSMTTAVTQSVYSSTLYYKFTANDGFYIANGSTYTTTISGTVPTNSAYASWTASTWGAFIDEPDLYSKIDFHIIHRGNVYYRQAGTSSWHWLVGNTPGETHAYAYFKKNVYYQVYASYVATAGSTGGWSTSTYGTATDTHTSSSSPRSVFTNDNAATFTFSGTLTARSVTINQVRAAHKTGVVMQYRDLNNNLLTKSNPTINTLSASVWRGAPVTLTATGTFTPSTGWTHNYNRTFMPGTYSLSADLVATYNYSTYSSTSGSGPSLTHTFSTDAITNPSIAVVGNHGSEERIVTLTSTSTYGATGGFASARLVVTATRSSSMVTVSAQLGGAFAADNDLDIYVCQNTIAPPAMRWDSGQTTIYVYNPNNLAFKFTGTVRYRNSQTVTFATSVSIAGCTSASYGLAMTGAAATGSVTSAYTTSWYSSNSTLP